VAVHECLKIVADEAVVELVGVVIFDRVNAEVACMWTTVGPVDVGARVGAVMTFIDPGFEEVFKAKYFGEEMKDEFDIQMFLVASGC